MSPEIPRDASGRVIRPRPSQLLADVMDALGPDHLTTRTLMAALIERDRGAGVEPRAVTPGYGWHLPVLADPPNVPYDMQEQALDVEATLGDTPRDTGWRDISSLLINGWTSAPLALVVRRVGRRVDLVASKITAPATYSRFPVGPPPPGWAGLSTYNGAWNWTTNAAINGYAMTSAANWLQIDTAANYASVIFRTSLSYLTDQPWPASLPGTPVTAAALLAALAAAGDTEVMPA